ncbi:alpha/beta hydrolase [Bacillus sp. BRMEA1]|uniref:alpha/beta fold hydrolase n=1 Tax=Neobacillus endophyticus TaxID=2738405 RepID=UPI00156468E4|nr:alpha/beta hydrolase [Neobacillus endophyticus]NRD79016.1 alpha/beta hydrolase [Neobacillus endophyticus]NRD81104.1 alpha/beta hydrolase [Neobacillus endophyticus]
MERKFDTVIVDGNTIEYSITEKGEIPVFVMHGGHSNCYEEFGYRALVQNGFSVITPSRAGYGRTTKEIGESLYKACEYYMKLLDHLEIEKVHLLSVSAGGPTGIYFASHYPHRVKTLTLQSAVTKEWLTPKDKEYKIAQILFRPQLEKTTWKLISCINNRFPKFIFKQMLSSFSKLSYAEMKSKMAAGDIDEIRKMNNRQRSGHGFLIDLLQTKEVTFKDLQAISCPTLIMHSKHDGAVSFEHAYYAQQQITDSEVCLLDSWGHLIWLGQESENVNEKLVEFLTRYS